jgi:fumarate hydratase class II
VLGDHQQYLCPLTLEGMAVGRDLNTYPKFAKKVIFNLRELTDIPLTLADNRFSVLATHEPLVDISAALGSCPVTLLKIFNDTRWFASSPNASISGLKLPEDAPSFFIMPR